MTVRRVSKEGKDGKEVQRSWGETYSGFYVISPTFLRPKRILRPPVNLNLSEAARGVILACATAGL